MNKLRIVYFDFITHYGGAQRCTTLLCRELIKSSDLHVLDPYGVCRDYLQDLEAHGIPTDVLMPQAKKLYIGHRGSAFKRAWSLAGQVVSLRKLQKRLETQVSKLNPDVIWTNSTKALLLLLTSRFLRRRAIVIYAHGWYNRSQVTAGALGRWLIKRADGVFAVSNPTARALQSWGVRKQRIHVVYNAIDFDQIVQNGSGEHVAPLPGLEKDRKILLPAQLLRAKGQHTAVEAAVLLKEKGFNFVMWLAGDIKMGVGDEYSRYLGKIIADYSVETNVFLLGYRKDVGALMRLCDFVILPSHSEGLPCVVQEAMILRRPVIATDVGGIPDLVVDGQTGLIVPIDDAGALAQAVEKLISDTTFYDRIVNSAYQRMCEQFPLDKHVCAVQAAFEQIVANKTKGPT